MVCSLRRIAGAEGIQDQFAEEVFSEGVFGLGTVKDILALTLPLR